MNITINGAKQMYAGAKSLNEIVLQFSQNKRRVVAELNGEIIKNHRWDEVVVKDGDILELVSFVGGG